MVLKTYSTIYRCPGCGKSKRKRSLMDNCVKTCLLNNADWLEFYKIKEIMCEICEKRFFTEFSANICEVGHTAKKDAYFWSRSMKPFHKPQSKLKDSKGKFIY